MHFIKYTFLAAILLSASSAANAQKWQPGHFIDVKGVRSDGFIIANPGGNGPIKNEGFIEFKDGEKTEPYKLSTSDLQSYVVGKDSFVVAHAPGNETWAKKELDFVRVVVNEETKIYATRGAGSGSGTGKKVRFSPSVGLSTGGGGYGGGLGGGLGINLGGGGGGSVDKSKLTYYYGSNTASMQHLTENNFVDVMSEAMGDEPEAVEQIRAGRFGIGNIDKLVDYFNKVKASHK
ncbi:hypothetical protein [Mucilaginibacter gilvus]|uniref:DUF4369 domain-containing protein n=1 Tax=Mucilaginibacter gilvus TaxID=2305909 RepID=A0A3S3YTV2_9SPHI|nr:hypothetical protein [Mucilaginibacter gilvus]RWY50175.1 hypothetical protein EPL05_15595 [Mucilaginibacter gilvus]